MRLTQPDAVIEIPDKAEPAAALARTTHLGIGAHADDLEVMAIDGILRCFGHDDYWFCGVVAGDGAGSPRSGAFAAHSDEQMREVRLHEQLRAAAIGEYGAVVLLDHTSTALKDPDCSATGDLTAVLAATRPEVVYTHSPTDRHDTHVAVCLGVIEAIRGLPPSRRPARLYGCEVWGDLDWLRPEDRVVFDLSEHERLQSALLSVFESQVSGKCYDLAAIARRRAHATFHSSHLPDTASLASFAVDLSPLITDSERPVADLVQQLLDHFAADVHDRIRRMSPRHPLVRRSAGVYF